MLSISASRTCGLRYVAYFTISILEEMGVDIVHTRGFADVEAAGASSRVPSSGSLPRL